MIYIYIYFFFLVNLIIIVIKKIIQPMSSTRLNPTHVGWVGLMWWVGLGWIFFFTHHGGLGQKIPSTRPTHTPTNFFENIFIYLLGLSLCLLKFMNLFTKYIFLRLDINLEFFFLFSFFFFHWILNVFVSFMVH